jgi:hypothetical protein
VGRLRGISESYRREQSDYQRHQPFHRDAVGVMQICPVLVQKRPDRAIAIWSEQLRNMTVYEM